MARSKSESNTISFNHVVVNSLWLKIILFFPSCLRIVHKVQMLQPSQNHKLATDGKKQLNIQMFDTVDGTSISVFGISIYYIIDVILKLS